MSALILGLVGPARAGKDTVASRLRIHGYARLAFADKLKDVALEINPQLCDRALGITTLRQVVTQEGWESAKRYPEVRGFLQRLGTSVRDHVDSDAWVRPVLANALSRAKHTGRGSVISDVRFPNELAAIRAAGGQVVLIVRPGLTRLEHVSEDLAWSLTAHDVDHVIVNDGTLARLDGAVDVMAGQLALRLTPAG